MGESSCAGEALDICRGADEPIYFVARSVMHVRLKRVLGHSRNYVSRDEGGEPNFCRYSESDIKFGVWYSLFHT